MMRRIETEHSDIVLVEPLVFNDDRGFFLETWNALAFSAIGIDETFVQDNHSRSVRNVLRGLHYQIKQPQGKLVRVIAGSVYDVAVDIRRSSPRFGQWVGVELSAENRLMLWVPPGFAHGFLSLQDGSELLYKCTDYHAPEQERTIIWSDPEIGIDWPLNDARPITSSKDEQGTLLRDADVYP